MVESIFDRHLKNLTDLNFSSSFQFLNRWHGRFTRRVDIVLSEKLTVDYKKK